MTQWELCSCPWLKTNLTVCSRNSAEKRAVLVIEISSEEKRPPENPTRFKVCGVTYSMESMINGVTGASLVSCEDKLKATDSVAKFLCRIAKEDRGCLVVSNDDFHALVGERIVFLKQSAQLDRLRGSLHSSLCVTPFVSYFFYGDFYIKNVIFDDFTTKVSEWLIGIKHGVFNGRLEI